MDPRPDCTRCRHFVVTWHPETPRGCRLFGFEGREYPSAVVQRSSGQPCRDWAPKALDAGPRPIGVSGKPLRR